MKSIAIVPYSKKKCHGARELAEITGVRCHSARYILEKPKVDVYINWGSTGYELRQIHNPDNRLYNKPPRVYTASNKAAALQQMRDAGIRVPWFTTSIGEAYSFMTKYDRPLVARTQVRGSKGRGIVFIERQSDFIDAPLYTEFIDKYREYRIHVFKNKAIDCVQKKRPQDMEPPIIWNYEAGFRFSHRLTQWKRGDIETLLQTAQRAVQALGLEFGAVDIMLSRGKLYVLEVNTAPGLNIEQTLASYAKQIEELKNEDNVRERYKTKYTLRRNRE